MTPETIASQLQSDILTGALPPGTPLSQKELAQRFNVSRIPVRDALALLAADGMINTAPNRTAQVIKMTRADVREMFHMRLLLEGDLIARAVPRLMPDDVRQIDYALQRSSLEARQDNWADGDRMFHTALYAPAQSPRQIEMIDRLRRACRAQIAGYGALTDKTDQWLSEHKAIVEACHMGNAKRAARLLRRHLKAARNTLLDAMRQD